MKIDRELFQGKWREAADAMNQQKEDLIKIKVTQRVGVDVRKPRWMPEFVWRWMWRRVVLIETPLEVTLSDMRNYQQEEK